MPEASLLSSLMPAAAELKKAQWKLYTALAVVVLIIVVVIIIIIRKKKKSQEAIDKEANDRILNEMNREIQSTDITLTQTQFNACASKLYVAMKGWGTNEGKIYAVFEEMNTRSDVLQLIKTFSIKDSQNLNEWLHNELNTKEIEHINEILSTKGINYSF